MHGTSSFRPKSLRVLGAVCALGAVRAGNSASASRSGRREDTGPFGGLQKGFLNPQRRGRHPTQPESKQTGTAPKQAKPTDSDDTTGGVSEATAVPAEQNDSWNSLSSLLMPEKHEELRTASATGSKDSSNTQQPEGKLPPSETCPAPCPADRRAEHGEKRPTYEQKLFVLQLAAEWVAAAHCEKKVNFFCNDGRKSSIVIRHGEKGYPVFGDLMKRMPELMRTRTFHRNGQQMEGDEPLEHEDDILVKENDEIVEGAKIKTIKTWEVGDFPWGPEQMRQGHPHWPGAEGRVTRIDSQTDEACLEFRVPFWSLDSLYNVRIPMDKVREYVHVYSRPDWRPFSISEETGPMSLKIRSGHGSLEQLVRQMNIDSDEEDMLSMEYKQRVFRDGGRAMREQGRRHYIQQHALRRNDIRSVRDTCRVLRAELTKPDGVGSECEWDEVFFRRPDRAGAGNSMPDRFDG